MPHLVLGVGRIGPRPSHRSALDVTVLRSPLTNSGQTAHASGTAWWVYVGKLLRSCRLDYVRFTVATGGVGTQTAEVAAAYSIGPPNGGSLTLTKIVADGTVDDLTATGMRQNTSALGQIIGYGAHLWLGIRHAMSVTQPTINRLVQDNSVGYILSTAAAGALTSGTSWTGSLIGAAQSAPALHAVLRE